ncbi:MAG: uroporphyrinogen-III synthase [Betaproteobacteria bacterium]
MTAPLAGRRILVTRPQGQSAALAKLIGEAGAEAILLPAIEIADPVDAGPACALLGRLESFDFAIFISANAAERGLALLGRPWPGAVRAAAVGAGTRRLLNEHGVHDVLAPEGRSDSEALLALPAFAEVRGRRVAIIRGEGGREVLRDALRARGAEVEYAECYRRVRPTAVPGSLLTEWARGEVHAVTVNSTEALSNLLAMAGEAGASLVRLAPLFAPHPRVVDEARRLGIARVVLAGPGDGEMLQALVAYFAQGTETR